MVFFWRIRQKLSVVQVIVVMGHQKLRVLAVPAHQAVVLIVPAVLIPILNHGVSISVLTLITNVTRNNKLNMPVL